MNDVCPRCDARFACGAAGAAPCACSALTLSPALLQRLRQEHGSCLCVACLAALAAADDGTAQAAVSAVSADKAPATAAAR